MASATYPAPVVVDASVVLKWVIDDEACVAQARRLRDDHFIRESVHAIAPQLLIYEFVNAVTTANRTRRIGRDKSIQLLSNFTAFGVELRHVEPATVLELAFRHNISAYDSAYLALAESEACELWTGDRPFYQALKGESLVKWIGDYAGPVL